MRAFSGRSFLQVSGVTSRVGAVAFSRMGCATATGAKEEQAAGAKASEAADAKQGNDLSAEVAKLQKQLEEATKTIKDLKNDVLYRAAEAENTRRIAREDVDKAKQYGISSFGKDMLEVIDTLEKGAESFAAFSAAELEGNKNLVSINTGIKMSVRVLQKNLGKHGIESMDISSGTKFDPNQHDALFRAPATEKAPDGHVCNVLKKGYTINGRILRAAQVGVACKEE